MLDIRLDELRARLGEKFTDDLYTREAHGRDENATPGQPPLAVIYAESVADIQALAGLGERDPYRRDRLWRRHQLRGAYRAAGASDQPGPLAHEPRRAHRSRRLPGRGSARRHAHNSEQRAALDRPLLPGRSRRRRLARRHGGDQRQRHDDRALRRHAPEYRRARGRAGQWRGTAARTPGAQDQQRLRPQRPLHRVGGHAGHHHQADACGCIPSPIRSIPCALFFPR